MSDAILGSQLHPWRLGGKFDSMPAESQFKTNNYFFFNDNQINARAYRRRRLFVCNGRKWWCQFSERRYGITHAFDFAATSIKLIDWICFVPVEKYDPHADEWTTVSSMFLRRTSVGAAVLECFNLERSLVQMTNLWHLTPIPENSIAAAAAATQLPSSAAST